MTAPVPTFLASAWGPASDEKPPEISVIINNYNYGRFVERAVDSALAQTGVRSEVIVVDDGSTDDSRVRLERYDDAILRVFKSNGGQASAINAGVEASSAPLLAFLDADDWWGPGRLAAVRDAFGRYPRTGLVYHRLQPVFSDGSIAFKAIPRSLCSGRLQRRLRRSGGRWPFPMTSSLSVRREAWDHAGPIPDSFRISADAWIVGVIPLDTEVLALPQALGFYRIHDNSWYRATEDAVTLRRRIDHWEATLAATNALLQDRGEYWRLRLEDHFAYQAAAAKLGRPDAPRGLGLLWRGLRDPAEPNLARRGRDALRAMREARVPPPPERALAGLR